MSRAAPDIPATMSGVLLTGHGGPEVLEFRTDIPTPRPGPGEVLVRVAAAGVNNTDINTRVGWYAREVTGPTDATAAQATEGGGWAGGIDFPRIQGGDLCGHVVALGAGVTGPPLGARVTCPINLPEPAADNPVAFRALGSELDGAFAEYCVVPARHLHDVSASPLSDVEIGAMPCAFGTALNLLTRAGVAAGEEVLVTGASGGVGMAAVMLAALSGASVVGVCAPGKAEAVRKAGAVATIDRGAALPARAFHAVIDVVGGPQAGALLDALRPGGRYATSGAIAGPIIEADLRSVYLNDLSILGATFQPVSVFARLVALINEGRVRPLVSRTYPLREIVAAQADFAAKTWPGKLVLIP